MQRISVVTAGGEAPGMNAAIRSVVRTALFNGLEVKGVKRGYTELIEGKMGSLGIRSVSGIINRGGTMPRPTRCEEIKTSQGVQKAAHTLTAKIDGFVVIGGGSSFRGASELFEVSHIPRALL